MQAIVWVTSTIVSRGTMYSRSGTGCLGMSHGVTRRIFFQCTASMSTMRSLMTGMLPIGSTSMTPSRARRCALSRGGGAGRRFVGVGWAGEPRAPVDAHAAGAADRGAAGAADPDRAVEARLGLED